MIHAWVYDHDDPDPEKPEDGDALAWHEYIQAGQFERRQLLRLAEDPPGLRDFLQYCRTSGGGTLLAPHVTDGREDEPYHLRLATLGRKFHCNAATARWLGAMLLVLQASPTVVEYFAAEARTHGLAQELLAEEASPEDAPTASARDDDSEQWGPCEPVRYHPIRRDDAAEARPSHPLVELVRGAPREHLSWLGQFIYQKQRTGVEAPWGAVWFALRGCILATMLAEASAAYRAIAAAPDRHALGRLGKRLYHQQARLTGPERKVLWGTYQARKAALQVAR